MAGDVLSLHLTSVSVTTAGPVSCVTPLSAPPAVVMGVSVSDLMSVHVSQATQVHKYIFS